MVKMNLSPTPSDLRWAARSLQLMTVEEKVGQMLVVRAPGNFLNTESEALRDLDFLVAGLKVGGLTVFAGQPLETAWLVNHLQKLAAVPLLVSSDFERGAANRVEGATLFPPLMAIGAADSEELAFQMGRITAVEGRAMGIHQALAPVADVNINPLNPIINTRSVGEDPEQVARLTRAFILGCQQNGMLATAKHYPGHGDTDIDTHLNLAVIHGDRERLEKVELYPFRRLVDAGILSIMTGHLAVPALDATAGQPATLSPAMLTEILRKQMGFQGLIISDAMDMGGITSLLPAGEAAVRAVEAGVDMVLLSPKPREAGQALVAAVRSGRIPEKRIDASVRRILNIKARLGLGRQKMVALDRLPEIIGSPENRRWAARAFRDSLTLVKNEGEVLPLTADLQKIAVLSLSSDEGGYFAGRTFVQEIGKRRPDAVAFYADAHTGPSEIEDGLHKAGEAEAAVVALFSSLRDRKGTVGLSPAHVQAVKDLAAVQKNLIVVSFGSPYFLQEFPEVPCYLCAYKDSDESQQAAAGALFGEFDIKGRLPVSLPGLYERGHGLVLAARPQ
jgi:beta-N-acetylhexosaminidase